MKLLKYLTNWKYRYFLKKKKAVDCTIEDMLFKRFKTLEIREEVRQEYDAMKSRIFTFEEQIKNWPADKDVGDRKRIEDQKVLAERDRDRFLAQIKQLDIEVHGSKRTNELPDGATGIDQQIDSLRELVLMIKDYSKTL